MATYRVICRNPDCPQRTFTFESEKIWTMGILGIFGKPRQGQKIEGDFMIACPICGWDNMVHISEAGPDDLAS